MGVVRRDDRLERMANMTGTFKVCPKCKGSGVKRAATCGRCGGKGSVLA